MLAAATLLRSRELSSAELLAACLQRIDDANGGAPSFDGAPEAVNAWVRLYPELAQDLAAAADRRLDRERGDAPLLCGIPIAVKDLYSVAGLPVTASSRVLDGNTATADSTAWARLREQGMVLVGHTHTHEFAAGGTTDQVGNPWALDRAAGGSSGGSAAALAARMVPAALGTDTLGSLRIPSALCGTSAVKPTHGRVPMDGVVPLAQTLDHSGPMARSVADCSALLAALASGGAQVSPLMPPPAAVGPLPLEARLRPAAARRVDARDHRSAPAPGARGGRRRGPGEGANGVREARCVLRRASGAGRAAGRSDERSAVRRDVGVSPPVRGPRRPLPAQHPRAGRGGREPRRCRGLRWRPAAARGVHG